MAVIQIKVLAESLDFESAVATKKNVACCDNDLLVGVCYSAVSPVTDAALVVNLALIQV